MINIIAYRHVAGFMRLCPPVGAFSLTSLIIATRVVVERHPEAPLNANPACR
jgi:hypothetical protein